jgi:hypothetical protein
VYTVVQKTLIDGQVYFDRQHDLAARPALEKEKQALIEKEKQAAAEEKKHEEQPEKKPDQKRDQKKKLPRQSDAGEAVSGGAR